MADGATPMAHGADKHESKVERIVEGDLCSDGFRSQKELSVVSKNKVWSLVKGYVGSNSNEAAIFIKDKAVAARHSEVFTIDQTNGTDGYWIAAATLDSSTNLLLSAERGVRTRAELKVGGIFKVGAEVQLEVVRIEVKPRTNIGDALAKFRTHASISDMFGHVEAMVAKPTGGAEAALFQYEMAVAEGKRDPAGRTLAPPDGSDGGGAASGAGAGSGDADGSAKEASTPRSESRKEARAAALANHAAFRDSEPVRKASHDRHISFGSVAYNDGEKERQIGPGWWQRDEAAREAAYREFSGLSGRREPASPASAGAGADAVAAAGDNQPQYVIVMQVLAGPQANQLIVASSRDGSIVIGSDPTCDLVVAGAEVSPVHARISFQETEGAGATAEVWGKVSAERQKRGKDVGGPVSDAKARLPGAVSAPDGVDPAVISVKPYRSSTGPRTLEQCWIQDLAIGNRHGTQIAIAGEPVALQRGDIIVLCRQMLLEPPEGTWIGTSRKVPGADDEDKKERDDPDAPDRGSVVSGSTRTGSVVPYEGRAKKRGNKRFTPYALADRVELAILFHSETAAPPVLWSRLALRVTRTRRSRRKSLHRSSSARFPSECVSIGQAGAVIGRSPKCDVMVDDLTAANFHTQIVYVQDGYVLQTIAHPDFFGTFILLGRNSSPHDRYRHESKGLYQLEMNDIFKCGTTEFFVEEIKTETFFELKRRQGNLKQRVKLLRRSPLFSLLPDLDLTRIANAAVKVHAEAGDVIIQEGDPVNKDACFFFIERGDVTVSVRRRDGSGMEVINALGPGQCFGEMAMLAAERPRAATITARTKLTCYSLDWQSSKELLGPVMSAAMALIAEKREISIRMQLLAHLFPTVAATFSQEDLRMLAEAVTPISFDAGETVVRQGQDCTCVFFIVGGGAVLEKSKDGSPVGAGVDIERALLGSAELAAVDAADVATAEALKETDGLAGPGFSIGDVSVLLSTPHTATVKAKEPLACLALTKDAFNSLINPLARWLLKRWSHVSAVRKALAHVAKEGTSGRSASVNLDKISKQGSALDLGLNEGHSAQGVMQVAAAQHARSRAEKWRKTSAIRSSENSLVSFSSRDGEEMSVEIDNINKSLTNLDDELAKADADEPTSGPPAAGAGKKGKRSSVRQSLPPDIGWAATMADTTGSGSPHPAAELEVHAKLGVDTSHAKAFSTLHAEAKARRKASTEGPGPTLGDLVGTSKAAAGAGAEADDSSPRGGADGSGATPAPPQDEFSAAMGVDGDGASPTDGTADDGGADEGAFYSATETDADAGDEEGRKRRRKVRYAPRMRIPISSTNPTVEEVKMLSQIPRFLILRALTGPSRGTYFYITSDVTTIGGAVGDATILLPDRTLSPAHACIEYQDGAFWLRDLFSSTGTFLKLAAGKDYTMEMGDVFTIGHVELMVLGKPETPPENPPAPSKGCCSIT